MKNVYAVIKINEDNIEDINVLEVNESMAQAIHTIYKDLDMEVPEEMAEMNIEEDLETYGYVYETEKVETEDGVRRIGYRYVIRKSELS